jgi:hypothetical protein
MAVRIADRSLSVRFAIELFDLVGFAMDTKKSKLDVSDKEIAKRADAGLRALLKMPPKPHAEIAGEKKPKLKKVSGKRNRT